MKKTLILTAAAGMLFAASPACAQGIIVKKDGAEIKTATITSGAQKKKWDGRVPDNYLMQVLWYMAITEAEFAVIVAQLKWDTDGDVFKVTKEYQIERSDFQEEIDELMDAGKYFSGWLARDICPPLILPKI